MINVLFQTESHYRVDRNSIRNAITEALKEKVTSDTEVGVSIVGDRQMHELNRKYRKVDATTDVLSFPLNDPTEKTTAFVDSPDNILRLGDIVVSYPQAVEEAANDNKMVDDKIIELVLHGLNHLLGIHHPE
jgi:probable rRNA maturation factor